MLRLYLIRHGQSVNNVEPNFERHVFDPPLTELGIRQSQALGRLLKNGSDNGALRYGYEIQQLHVSPQLRALQTAAEILRQVDHIRPEINVRLHERGGVVVMTRKGLQHHPGLKRSEIAKQFPTYKIPYQITENGWWRGSSTLESNDDVRVRARVLANDLFIKARTARDLGLVIVSHGTLLNFLIQTILNDDQNRFLHHNAAISRIDVDRNANAIVKYSNDTRHLEQTWIT